MSSLYRLQYSRFHELLQIIPRCNVDMLKIIQLGLTLTDARGNLPLIGNFYCLWQFNFREFNLKEDLYAQDSIELLKHSGINFQANHERGIDVHRFGEMLMVSGVVLSDKVNFPNFL
jgi:CCR4-NOT transcription complex subunit 7/8